MEDCRSSIEKKEIKRERERERERKEQKKYRTSKTFH